MFFWGVGVLMKHISKVLYLKEFMRCNNFYSNIIHIFLMAVASVIYPVNADASMPIPSAIPLGEYIKTYQPMIYMGSFENVVYISKELGEKLFSSSAHIEPSELIFSAKETSRSGGESFIKITDVELLYIRPDGKPIQCGHFIAYQPTSISIQGESEIDIYYRGFIGRRVIFF